MRELPVVLEGYKLMVVEAPAPKTRTDERGNEVPVVDRDGVTQFVVSLFVRERSAPGRRSAKGEEIRVTLETDPGPGFGEDTLVALIDPRVTPYQMESNGRVNSGLAFKARGLAPAGGAAAPRPAPKGEDK
jgi:hypothetical protein